MGKGGKRKEGEKEEGRVPHILLINLFVVLHACMLTHG